MNKPRIVILIPRFGVIDRGAEVSSYELAKRLSKDLDVTIISRKRVSQDSKSSWQDKISGDIKHVKVDSLTEHNRFVNYVYKLHPNVSRVMDNLYINPLGLENLVFSFVSFIYLLFYKVDIINPCNGIWGAYVGRILRIIKGTPFFMRSTGGIEPIVAKQKPNLLVCESPAPLNWYKRYHPNLSLKLISPGVDMNKFNLNVKSIKTKLQKPIYLGVGALISSKRFDLAIEAVAKLSSGSLIIIGEGPEKNNLLKLGKNKLGKNRFLVKSVIHEEIHSYYKLADVFTLPSFQEPFGIVYLEAMATNKCVVAPIDEQRKYVVGDAGILCDVTDSVKYSEALRKAYKTNFGTIPLRQAAKFSWDIIYNAYRKSIFKIINEHSKTI